MKVNGLINHNSIKPCLKRFAKGDYESWKKICRFVEEKNFVAHFLNAIMASIISMIHYEIATTFFNQTEFDSRLNPYQIDRKSAFLHNISCSKHCNAVKAFEKKKPFFKLSTYIRHPQSTIIASSNYS